MFALLALLATLPERQDLLDLLDDLGPTARGEVERLVETTSLAVGLHDMAVDLADRGLLQAGTRREAIAVALVGEGTSRAHDLPALSQSIDVRLMLVLKVQPELLLSPREESPRPPPSELRRLAACARLAASEPRRIGVRACAAALNCSTAHLGGEGS